MVIIAVDLGARRTGLAACDKNEILASPMGVVRSDSHAVVIAKIIEVAAERGAEKIVVGEPRNMDGSESERGVITRSFVRKLVAQQPLPVETIDERLTTVEAEELWGKRDDIDALSAVIILEDYLRHRAHS